MTMPANPTPAALAALDPQWVVWSYEHDAGWASNSCGYVQSLLLAGIYDETEAKAIERGANAGGERYEEARPLSAALEAEYERWGRRGGMVIDALLAAARQGEETAKPVPCVLTGFDVQPDEAPDMVRLTVDVPCQAAFAARFPLGGTLLLGAARAAAQPSTTENGR